MMTMIPNISRLMIMICNIELSPGGCLGKYFLRLAETANQMTENRASPYRYF
jgi:hypothetical protein